MGQQQNLLCTYTDAFRCTRSGTHDADTRGMTKQHFQLLADALKAEMPGTGWDHPNKRVQWLLDVRAVTSVCAQSNARFDRDRFLTACGVSLDEQ